MSNATQHFNIDRQFQMRVRPIPIVPDRPLRTRLLLAEARTESLSMRTLLLSNSAYHVATASTRKEIFDLRCSARHSVVLSDILGSLGLRSLAEDVRRQWPIARVLIIGAAQVALDDPLYDEAVERRVSPADLLAVLTKLSAYSYSQRVEAFRLNPGNAHHEETFEHNRKSVPVESDPTKDPGYDPVTKEEAKDLPADEHRDWRH